MLRNFTAFGNQLLNKAGDLLKALGMSVPPLQISSSNGLPVAMHSTKGKLKVRLMSVGKTSEANAKAANYKLPVGYTRSVIPFTSG